MFQAYLKFVIAYLTVASLLVVGVTAAETNDYKIPEDGMVRISCTDSTQSSTACARNGEVSLSRGVPNSDDHIFSYGQGVRCECEENGPATILNCSMTCECNICNNLDENNCTTACELISAASSMGLPLFGVLFSVAGGLLMFLSA